MGLDVYLYKYENKEKTILKEKEYEELSEANWKSEGEYDSLDEKTKKKVRAKNKKLAISMGLDDDGEDFTAKQRIEINSTIDPEHYFKIGYFRSSYNGSGINRVLENLGINGLYEVFHPNDEYCFSPDWQNALKEVNSSIKKLEKRGAYRSFAVSENIFGQNLIGSEKEAIDILIGELARHTDKSFDSYSNSAGEFFLNEPLRVMALIPGKTNVLGERKCTYVVIKSDNEWIMTALKIVRETIEYVLAQPDPQKYYLHWSS